LSIIFDDFKLFIPLLALCSKCREFYRLDNVLLTVNLSVTSTAAERSLTVLYKPGKSSTPLRMTKARDDSRFRIL